MSWFPRDLYFHCAHEQQLTFSQNPTQLAVLSLYWLTERADFCTNGQICKMSMWFILFVGHATSKKSYPSLPCLGQKLNFCHLTSITLKTAKRVTFRDQQLLEELVPAPV